MDSWKEPDINREAVAEYVLKRNLTRVAFAQLAFENLLHKPNLTKHERSELESRAIRLRDVLEQSDYDKDRMEKMLNAPKRNP